MKWHNPGKTGDGAQAARRVVRFIRPTRAQHDVTEGSPIHDGRCIRTRCAGAARRYRPRVTARDRPAVCCRVLARHEPGATCGPRVAPGVAPVTASLPRERARRNWTLRA